jgi:hypothetical protein
VNTTRRALQPPERSHSRACAYRNSKPPGPDSFLRISSLLPVSYPGDILRHHYPTHTSKGLVSDYDVIREYVAFCRTKEPSVVRQSLHCLLSALPGNA